MSTQRLQREMNDREAIEQDLEDSSNELSYVANARDLYRTVMEEQGVFGFSKIIEYLGQDEAVDQERVVQFLNETDAKRRLELIHKMSLLEALQCLAHSEDLSGFGYMTRRLGFYKKLIAEEMAKEEYGKEWYSYHQEGVKASVKMGILRDTLYAAMQKTPELGAVKMATRRVKERLQRKAEVKSEEVTPIKSVVQLFGYYSGIDLESIGQWEDLADLYQKCLKEVEAKYRERKFDAQTIEHKAVLLMSDRLEKAYEYAGVLQCSNSPYSPSFNESVVASRLGHSVMRQLRGMRRKILDTDLHNIHRFIGKSGENRHVLKKRALERQLKEAESTYGKSSEEANRLRSELDVTMEKYHRHASLAQKAIDLHFTMKQAGDDKFSAIDWINKAQFGLINWTYNAIHRGVSKETAFAYAKTAYAFPNQTVTRPLIEMMKSVDGYRINCMREIGQIHSARGIEATPEEMLVLSNYIAADYKALLDQGYSKEAILRHPWLIDQRVAEINMPFPFGGRRGQQEAWCAENAFHKPYGWNPKRVGQIMLARLDGGVDGNVHDASYWFKEFEVPEEKGDVAYKNPKKEIDFICSAIKAPAHLKSRIPTKPSKYTELFSNEANELIYGHVLNLMNQGEVDFEELKIAVLQDLNGLKADSRRAKSLKTSLPKLEEDIQEGLNAISNLLSENAEVMSAPALVGELRQMGERRKVYIDTAQAWVLNNASTPRTLLTYAWANRELALQDGCEDNPRAIKQWADLNGLRSAYISMKNEGRLPRNLEEGDIKTYNNWLTELVRCYNGETAINTLSKLKDNFNPECEITPMKIDLGNGWIGEILKKNDPRGATIGFDTGCCMTLGGASESCIYAGYSKAPYGFFALYRDDKLVAQSFLYTNSAAAPDVIVADNIEANQGRDMGKVLEKYEAFFRQYFTAQLRRKTGEFSKLHVGEGYTSIALNHLDRVDGVHMPDSSIYTDAENQRVLLNIPASEAERLGKFKAERFQPSDWPEVREDILKIEEEAFGDNGYSEYTLESMLANPHTVAVVMRDGEKVIGYTVAEKQGRDTLHVMSTALAKKYQHQGLVSDMLLLMDEEARREGYKYYQREAAVQNGYAEKLMKNYNVTTKEGPFESPFGTQMRLRMEIPDHRLPNSMKQEIEEEDSSLPTIKFTKLSASNIGVAGELERKIYPEALQVGIETLAEIMEFENEEYENASFVVRNSEGGRNKPIGYAIAYLNESELNSGEEVLYINDVAIDPEQQRKGYGKDVLRRLISFSESRGNLPIEFHARERTSYQAIIHSEAMLEKLGYRIVHDELIEDYFEDADEDDRDVHFIRLEKVMQQKKAA